MRVAVVDIGTNSTRLLIADVAGDGIVTEIRRVTQVTRLGERVDITGSLADAAIGRVFKTLARYTKLIDEAGADARIAVLTSAVRDSANGTAFVEAVRGRFGLDARILSGAEEAQLTFLGVMSGRDPSDLTQTLVIDVGGGSTELSVGRARNVDFHVSLQAGVVRQSERHLHDDPPPLPQLRALAADVRALIDRDVPASARSDVQRAIAVGGTATSAAAIDQALDRYDPTRVHGYELELSTARLLLARLASVPLAERRLARGLHADRAPTIVAGLVILIEVLDAFSLDRFEASEHDILRGAALQRAGTA
jgi:exopolyphosphatase/guanosine-5'-triphosphate,3'-diphosphate pyrophosphatase